MDKIWIIKSNSKYTKKFNVYKKESDLLKAISSDSNAVILEYELKSSVNASDYITSKDRDAQIRSLLGELTEDEIAIEKFITLYEQIAPEGKEYEKRFWENYTHRTIQTSKKKEFLKKLKKFSQDKKEIVKILIEEKNYLFSEVSTQVEWYTTILNLHNFRDCNMSFRQWNSTKRIYERIDKSTQEIKDNFKLAKEELKKLKKKKV